MLASYSSSIRCIAISRSTNSPSAVELIDATHLRGPVSTNHRAVKRRADFERPALAHAATPAGPLTSTKGFIKRRMFNRIGVGDELPNIFWSAVGWFVLCLAPYVYALNDLITWR